MPETGEETFAAALRRLRGETTLRELGRRASCSKSIISDLEHERRSPTPPIARGLDKAVGAGGKLVSLAEAQREWDDVWRRDFLKDAGGAALAARLGAGSPAAAGSRDLMDAHRALRAAHGRLDNLRGASAVYAHAVGHHQQILAWHATAASRAEQQQIAALAADTGGFVGFLTYDLGMAENAATHYRDAAAHARQAGDRSSCVYLIGQMSRILTDQGHHRNALDLADGALRLAGTTAHPAVRSWLHAVRAHHHACLGDDRTAQSDLHAAWTLLEKADDGEKPTYIGYLGAPELHKWTGHAMVRLGQKSPAFLRTGRTALDDALAAWPAAIVRGSAEVLTASARIHAACGDRDTAADLASRAVAIATETGSARNLRAALTATTG
ncbi:helix-turn-helix transcriptional regulator [Streptomyces sp. NPDC048484]|uniref:helix-turn-helix domain-containing protein n=1 Tax=Streptomyces sp. NPDC048484 TaxID=3155146 RepID=UPI0034459A70